MVGIVTACCKSTYHSKRIKQLWNFTFVSFTSLKSTLFYYYSMYFSQINCFEHYFAGIVETWEIFVRVKSRFFMLGLEMLQSLCSLQK